MLARAGIYLDVNAGAPLKPQVREALLPFFSEGSSVLIPNPSSIHSHGRVAKRAMADAREKVALSLGAQTDPEQLVFTSSGTEANQLAVRSVLEPLLLQGGKPHWITTLVEHDSNRQMVQWLLDRGGTVSYLPVDQFGAPDVSVFPSLVRPETALVSVVWVNNETGVITDVSRLAGFTQEYSIPLHLDGAQAWGKIPFDLQHIGAQFVCFSGHKIGALAGTGVLWLGRGHPAHAVIPGKQEKGRRGGTENLLGIVSLGAAAATLQSQEWSIRLEAARDALEKAVCDRIPGTIINGGMAPRVANTSNLSFECVEGDGLVLALDLAGFSVSSGSACASGVLEPSHVLLAMGKTRAQAMAAVRISLGEELSSEVRERFIEALDKAVHRVRKASGRYSRPHFGENAREGVQSDLSL